MKTIKELLRESLADGNPYTSRTLKKVVELTHRARCNGQIKIVMNNHRYKGNYILNSIDTYNNKLHIAIENLRDEKTPTSPTNAESRLGKSKLEEFAQLLSSCVNSFDTLCVDRQTGRMFMIEDIEVEDDCLVLYLNR